MVEAEKVAAAKVVDDDVADINDGGGEDREAKKEPFTAYSEGLTTAGEEKKREKREREEGKRNLFSRALMPLLLSFARAMGARAPRPRCSGGR
jgi:hypothetical protein